MARKRNKNEEEAGQNTGLVMTVSLFLILLTFFVLLNSLAVLDEQRIRLAIGSLVGSFGSLPGGLSPMKTGESIMPPSPPMEHKPVDLGKLLQVEKEVLPGDITIKEYVDRELIRIQEKVLFEKDSHGLKKSAFKFLNKMAQIIKRGEYPVDIIVHTDNRPGPEKGYRSNWELTGLRAMAVTRYLVEKGRVAATRLTPCGRAKHEAVASNETRQSRELNRRIDVVLHSGAQPYVRRIFSQKPGGIFTYKRFNFRLF